MTEARSLLEPDPALLARARRGDEEAVERLLAGIRAPVRRLALTMIGRPDGAEDVTQEVLIRVALKVSELRSPEAFPGWLYRITRNASLDHVRARKRRGERREPLDTAFPREDPGAGRTALDRIRDRRIRALVVTFLNELPARQREVFDLVELKGYAPAEVAELLSLAPGSVRASLFKARRTLRSRILESHPELKEAYG